jgi:hypothetical protein
MRLSMLLVGLGQATLALVWGIELRRDRRRPANQRRLGPAHVVLAWGNGVLAVVALASAILLH